MNVETIINVVFVSVALIGSCVLSRHRKGVIINALLCSAVVVSFWMLALCIAYRVRPADLLYLPLVAIQAAIVAVSVSLLGAFTGRLVRKR